MICSTSKSVSRWGLIHLVTVSSARLIAAFLSCRHNKNIIVNLGKLVHVVSSKICEKKFFVSTIGFLPKVEFVTIAVVQFGPTIDMERLRCAPPLLAKAVITVFNTSTHGEPHVVKLRIGRFRFTADIKCKKLHVEKIKN